MFEFDPINIIVGKNTRSHAKWILIWNKINTAIKIVILTNISIFVECNWIMWESSVVMFGHMWPRPYVEWTCSLFSGRDNLGDWIQILKNGSIHRLHGLIEAQSKPESFIAVFLKKNKTRVIVGLNLKVVDMQESQK